MSRRRPRRESPKPSPPAASPAALSTPTTASAQDSSAPAPLPAAPAAIPVVNPRSSASPAPAGLAAELSALVVGLLFLSESEAPFTLIELPKGAILPDALRPLVNLPSDAPTEEWTIGDVLTPCTAPDQPDAARFELLRKFLEEKLTRAVVYKLGEVKKAVFFIGRQPNKSWLGVQTAAVET